MGLVVVALCFSACYYDNPPELSPVDPEDVSYGTHIAPIIESSCATTACHDGTVSPDLRAELAYSNIVNGGLVNLTVPDDSRLYRIVEWLETPMPPGLKLSELDRLLILYWIENGALHN